MNFKRISVNDSNELIKRYPESTILDIRDPASFDAGHIPNAILMNNERVEEVIKTSDKNAPLLVCCYHGNSSQQAASFFAEQGFTEAYSIDGGFEAWKLSLPVEN